MPSPNSALQNSRERRFSVQREFSVLSCLTCVSPAAPWNSLPVWTTMFLLQLDFNMWVFKSISKSLRVPNLEYRIALLIPSESIPNGLWSAHLLCLICHCVSMLTLPLLLPCNQLLWKQYIVLKVSLEKCSPTMHPLDKSSFSNIVFKAVYSVHRTSARCAHLKPASDYQFPCIVPQALHVHWNTTRSSHLSRLSGRHAWERLPGSRSGVYSAYGPSVPHSSKRRR